MRGFMDFGKCAFKDCKKPASVTLKRTGKHLLLCKEHWDYLTDLQTEDIIEKAFSIVEAESNNKEDSNVQIHSRSI